MDVLTCYDEDGTPQHLRCHFIDVTDRVLTERELLRRTREVSEANDRLRQINADLERLKESYRDLYHNAPVLYFSLDAAGNFVAFNETMLRTLGYPREELLGQPYATLLTPEGRAAFQADPAVHAAAPARSRRSGSSRTAPSSTCGSARRRSATADGAFVRSRSAARDVTETQPPGQRPAAEGHAAGQRQRPAAAHQPGAGGVHLRRLARPQGAAADPGGVQQLPAAGLRPAARRRGQGVHRPPGRRPAGGSGR